MKNIELEYRSVVDEAKYKDLLNFLNVNAENLGENNKHTFHFILSDKLVNVTDLQSKNSAKIVLKLGKIGKDSHFEEVEIPIEQKYYDKAVYLFKSLGVGDIIESVQTRTDYKYKEVELAVKYSLEWGYHVELERVVDESSDMEVEKNKIFEVANELGLKILTDEELRKITSDIEAKHKK